MSAVNDVTLSIIKNFVAGDYSTTELVGDLEALEDAYLEERTNAVREAVGNIERPAIERIKELEAALEALRAPTLKVIKIDWPTMFSEAKRRGENFVDYVKWVRSSGVINLGDGSDLGLYEAKNVAELVCAYYSMRPTPQFCRGENVKTITGASTREDVRLAVSQFLVLNYKHSMVQYSAVWD